MKLYHLPVAALLISLAAGCASERRAPPPTPAPSPAPTPATVPVQQVPPADWIDAPQTPGDWTYRALNGGSQALFGVPASGVRFAMNCTLATRTITLSRAGQVAGTVPMRILTETQTRLIDARSVGDTQPGVAASLNARDPLLDAMAFSKGRFGVETAGLPTLYLPAWPEVSRVIEDCR